MIDTEIDKGNCRDGITPQIENLQGIKSLIAVPIFINGKLHGFLGIDNPRSHKDALTLLTQLTYIIANELQKRLLTEALMR